MDRPQALYILSSTEGILLLFLSQQCYKLYACTQALDKLGECKSQEATDDFYHYRVCNCTSWKDKSHHLSHTLYQHFSFPGIHLIRSDAQIPWRDTGNKEHNSGIPAKSLCRILQQNIAKYLVKYFTNQFFFLINTFYRPVRKPYWPTPMVYVRTLSPLHIPGIPCGVIISPDPWK